MTTSCHHCGAETSNGLALCDLCRRKAETDLVYLPVYFRNLARWRPGRAGSRPVPGSQMPPGAFAVDGSSDAVTRALEEAGADLVGWARALTDDRPGFEVAQADDEQGTVAALCEQLGAHLTSIATLPWAGDFVTAVGCIEATLRELTERVAPGWYAGACRRCGHPTHVVPGLTWVTCGGCGATTYARDHLDTVLAEARGWVAPPKRIAEAIVALVDTELSVPRLHDRIRLWASRERITPIRATDRQHVWDPDLKQVVVATVKVGRARYRMGEVMDRIRAEGATRIEKTERITA